MDAGGFNWTLLTIVGPALLAVPDKVNVTVTELGGVVPDAVAKKRN